jgi:hypothetical protein
MNDIRLDELKRHIRKLKHLEEKLRFGGAAQARGRLVWDKFFETHGNGGNIKYPLEKLASMSKEAYKKVVDEYFAYIYYELYRENGMIFPRGSFNPELLARLDLPADAGEPEIKSRFRELAKKHHPDTGGDAARFIELMDTYKQLMETK